MICTLNFHLSVCYLDSYQIYSVKQHEAKSIITRIPNK